MKKVRGRLTHAPRRRLRILISAQLFWLAIVCVLGAWWSRLVLHQAERIAELETAAGLATQAAEHELRTQRMVFWESLFYFGLLIGSTSIVFWLYWRDERRSRGVQAFFASMTHELRTPLTSIRLQAESIADNLASDPSQKAWIDRLLEDTTRLESQVDRTLELARVEGGGPVFPEPIEIKSWIDRQAGLWRETYGPRARFALELSEDVSVLADPTALGVIFRNLHENSLRHSRRDPLEIFISAQPEDGGVELVFRDNGAAKTDLDAEKLGVIFEKGPGSSGTGVGLYLIRTLIEQMGGGIRFLGGQGFEVRIWLPSPKPEREGGRAHG